MDSEGKLEWEVPAGEWVIMRFAHEPTGGPLRHGRANLMGLECDKMSVEAVTVQWEIIPNLFGFFSCYRLFACRSHHG